MSYKDQEPGTGFVHMSKVDPTFWIGNFNFDDYAQPKNKCTSFYMDMRTMFMGVIIKNGEIPAEKPEQFVKTNHPAPKQGEKPRPTYESKSYAIWHGVNPSTGKEYCFIKEQDGASYIDRVRAQNEQFRPA